MNDGIFPLNVVDAQASLLLHVAKLGKKDRFNPAALRALITLSLSSWAAVAWIIFRLLFTISRGNSKYFDFVLWGLLVSQHAAAETDYSAPIGWDFA